MPTGVYERKNRGHYATSVRITAETANQLGLACKYGHKGQWRTDKRGKSSKISRHCGACRPIHVKKYLYGLDHKTYEKMLKGQDGKCAICDCGNKRLFVDHDHLTGKVRALLCNACNTLAGYLESAHIEPALDYLSKHNSSGADTLRNRKDVKLGEYAYAEA